MCRRADHASAAVMPLLDRYGTTGAGSPAILRLRVCPACRLEGSARHAGALRRRLVRYPPEGHSGDASRIYRPLATPGHRPLDASALEPEAGRHRPRGRPPARISTGRRSAFGSCPQGQRDDQARPCGCSISASGPGWSSPAFPEGEPQALGLASGGLAATTSTDGRLAHEPGGGTDRLVHDPWRPAPLIGGTWGSRRAAGSRRSRRPHGCRGLHHGRLAGGRRIIGRVALDLHVTSDMPSMICTAP